MGRVQRFHRDVVSGALLLLFGAAVALQSATYDLGTLTQMGPGYFPLLLGIVLIVLGGLIAGTAITRHPSAKHVVLPDWRAWALICAGLAGFLFMAERFGLIPGTFVLVFVSALADRKNTVRDAAFLAAAMVLAAIVVFWWGLQIQLPLLRWS